MLPTIAWKKDGVVMIDQRKLPNDEVYVECSDYEEVAEAIENMTIRGAPAIGVAAAYGVALGIMKVEEEEKLQDEFERIYRRLERTRPTARNLGWSLEEMKKTFVENHHLALDQIKRILLGKAQTIEEEDVQRCRKIGSFGKILVEDGQSILTHCNAGALATAGYGTALGIVRAVFEEGKSIRVYVGETRPFLQGARLTCWELDKDHIPVVLITDNMAGHLMFEGEISLVVTGADRIASNGDTANKIGTYSLAVLAKENEIPFYVAAPISTVDFSLSQGDKIPIEERNPNEVRTIGDCTIAPAKIKVRNPVFDVTPADYITAIVTEYGLARPPYVKSLQELKSRI